MATVALPSVGASRTISVGWSRRARLFRSVMVDRFAAWHGVERRVDVWASAGAFAFAGLAMVAAFSFGPF